jgi:alpha-D-xyloside xylohydrolase
MNIQRLPVIYVLLLANIFPAFCQTIRKEVDGIVYSSPSNVQGFKKIYLKVRSDDVIQVIISPGDTFSSRKSLMVTEEMKTLPKWKVEETGKMFLLSTQNITVQINKNSGKLNFLENNGTTLLSENEKSIESAIVVGETCYHIKQSFKYTKEESLYGLGSYMDGEVRLNDKKVTMLQRNREDVVPVVLSTNHYAILWDNYSLSEFNDTKDGYYLWSEVADEINYYFIHGNTFDQLVSAYRQLTGVAPMFPKWAFGYIQSKQKYNTQNEIVSVVKKFRELKFPLDLIVQDWQYWPEGQWGQKSFNRKNYPDPEKMMDDIHAMNSKIIISIWPNMVAGTPNNLQLQKINGLLNDGEHLNIMIPAARQLYWKQANDSLFHYGIDGWWADCSEGYDSDWSSPFFKLPEVKLKTLNSDELKKLFGSGRYINAYALMHTKGLYEGQRDITSDKRVFILTRSSFGGMQKYSASYWTGDVSANWEDFREQIPAGINFCMSGIPYWTTDIAGYFIRHEPGWWFSRGAYENGQQDSAFLELYTRWFQFASFCPLFRAHGADFPREPWAFGDSTSQTYRTLLKFTSLRYRLIPYIYSLAWKVTDENYTLLRGLVFDFQNDSLTYNINDQYMFGPSFLVAPVVRPLYYHRNNVKMDTKEYTRSVYLPKSTQWIDFWKGITYMGGDTIKADVSYETMPLFVKAGSIIPFGPFIQYSTEKTDPLEIRIYPGADGKFTLYEDENDNYNYEKGIFSLITFLWNDTQKTLVISDREGDYPGMPKDRIFNIVLVNEQNGKGVEISPSFTKSVHYKGGKIVEKL